jgi:hypothetical protein
VIGFLVAHGWENRRPAGHWQHWPAGEPAAAGHAVVHPQSPSPDEPVLEERPAELRRHRARDDGYGAWPSLLRRCTDPSVRITAR